MSKIDENNAKILLYTTVSITFGLLIIIILLKAFNIDIIGLIFSILNFILKNISAISNNIINVLNYDWTKLIGIIIGFIIVFIFSFLLGFGKIDSKVGIPIIITFGLITIYPLIIEIFTRIISLIKAIYKVITSSTFDLSPIYNAFFDSKNTSKLYDLYEKFVVDIKEWINKIDDKTKETNMEKLKKDLISNLPIFLFVILISVVIYYANKDPETLTTGAYKYFLVLFIPLLIFMWYYMSAKSSEYTFISMFVFCIIAFVGVYIWMSMNKSSLYVWSLFSKYFLIPIIVIVGFAIFYKIILEYLNKLTGVSRFILDFIFFIPCLLIDFLEYIKQQFKLTPNIVYILLFIEILLILLFFYLPDVISNAIQKNSKVLQMEPLFLNKETLIGTSSIGLMDKSTLDLTETYRQNYSISFWTIINTHGTINNGVENTIFKYGSKESYKPRVSHTLDNTGDNFIFQLSTNIDTAYKISLPSQKWHNFVFNYNNSRVDLFINGKLEKTYEFVVDNKTDLPTYSSTDEIKVGGENGLDGAICNVQYYSVPLTNTDIANLYNLYMLKNPPI